MFLKKHIILSIILFSYHFISAKEYFVQFNSSENIEKSILEIKNTVKIPFTYFKAFKTLREKGLDRVYVLDFEIPLNKFQFDLIQMTNLVTLIEEVPEYQFSYTPNDHNSNTMWNLEKINARQAWDLEKGGKNIVVALIDDGMDTAHSDLQPTLWKNVNEIPNNGIDDDNNGYIDDVFGWDMADNDNDPHVTVSNNLSHGTHCAGTIGARTDNNNGISGIGFNVKIMAIKCGRNSSSGIFNPYQGVEYAIENGARVISMSWGGGSYSYIYQLIFDVAAQREIVCVAAAGNSSTNTPMYPAGYNKVIAVGSTTSTDAKSNFSNYGTWIDVMAPGSSIYSTIPGNSYGYKSGTSMACPLVSGLCALMLSRNPNLTAAQVESCLKNTCDNIDSVNQSYLGSIGAGRINAYKALLCVKTVNAQFTTSKQFLCAGDTVRYIDKSVQTPNSWYWEFQGGTPSVSTNQNPFVRYNSNGTYKVKLTVIRGNDTDVIEKLNYITIGKPEVRFSGVQTINKGEYATIKADFTGVAPWTLVYQDKNKKDTIYNILQTPYFILKTPDSSIVYKPISVSSFGCFGTVKDSTKITVTNQISNSNCDSSLRFHATFGGSGDDQLNYVNVINDTIIYVVGKTTSSGQGNYDAYVAKLNINGTIIWSKTIGGTAEDVFLALRVDKFENIYCGGYTHSNITSRSAFMVKIDKNGTLKWKKYFDGGTHELIYNLTFSKNEDFIIFVGHCSYNGYGSSDNCVYRIDTAGNIDWVKQFGTTNQERPYGVICDNSDNIYISGLVYPNSVPEGSIIKITSNGTVDYFKKYVISGNNGYSEFTNIEIHNNRNLYIIGRQFYNSLFYNLLIKTDLQGNVIWAKYFYMGSQNNPNLKIINNHIYVVDRVSISGKSNGSIFKFDTLGNILESKIISHPTNNLIVTHMDFNSNIEAVYVGYQNSGNNQFLIGKTNCKLNNSCLMSNRTPTITNSSYSVSNFSYSLQNKTKQATTSHSLSNYNISSLNYTCKSNLTIVNKPCKLKGNFSSFSTCIGDTTYFIGSAIDSNQYDINGWYWDFGDNTSISGLQSPLKLYQQAGIYNVKLIVTSSQGNHICADTIQKNININDSIKILFMPTNATICIGDSVQPFSPFAICGTKPYQYEWLPNLNLNNNKIAQPYFSPKETTTYLLTITDQNGKKAYDSLTFIVDKSCCKSVARFEIKGDNICQGDSITFINTSTYDGNSAYFLWKFTGANINSYTGINPPTILFSNSGNAKAELFLSDICSNDTFESNFFIFPKPIANAGSDYTICGMDTLQLGEESFGRTIYQWSPTTGLSNPFLSNPILKTNVAQKYILSIVDEYGCKNSDSMNVSEGQKPKIFGIQDTIKCLNTNFIYQLTPIAGQTYRWYNQTTGPSLLITLPGKYFVEAKAECGDTTAYFEVFDDRCQCDVWIPNGFSPNKNNINDYFSIKSNCQLIEFDFRVFNRWGEIIYKTNDPNFEWDGKFKGDIVPNGVYYYLIKYRKNVQNIQLYEQLSGFIEIVK